jgi:cytochrome c oxidase assembly protein subunit 11
MSGTTNRRVAFAAIFGGIAMLGLTYASVPLYSLFCKATGYNGTPRRVAAADKPAASDKLIDIRFDANTAASLNWNFHPVQPKVTVKLGDQTMAFFRARNLSNHTLTGSAVFNVTPASAGAYFNKIQCFCFTSQTLKAGESVDMPVVFYVDPAIAQDPDSRTIGEITLSYTFYPADTPKTAAQVPSASASATN